MTVGERFNKFVGPLTETGCRNWLGSLTADGYGRFRLGTKTVRAHRVSYQLKNGPIPDGSVIRHKCDNPKCVEETHLEPGTDKDNHDDMIRRGRMPSFKGDLNGRAKLTEDQVGCIRADTRRQCRIAAEYRVSRQTISAIKNKTRCGYL